MADLIINTTTAIANKELKRANDKIVKATDGMNRDMMKLAVAIKEAKEVFDTDSESIKETDNFASFVDYSKKVLNMTKTTAYRFIDVAKNFLATDKSNVIVTIPTSESGRAWTISQLSILCKLGEHARDIAIECIEDGNISSDMSCKELDEAINNYLNPVIEDDTTGEESEESERNEEAIEAVAKVEKYKMEFVQYDDDSVEIKINGESWTDINETTIRTLFNSLLDKFYVHVGTTTKTEQ